MRAVLVNVTEREIAERRRTGLDRYDEMWDGVLHMTPAPSTEHQRIVGRLIEFLSPWMRNGGRGTLWAGINVFAEECDYRIPDLTFVAAGRESLLADDGVRGGGPDCVIEVRSPGDETYEKLPFFARIGTREVVVIERDTKRPEIFRLAGSQYVAVATDREGWLASEALRIRLRGDDGKLLLEDADAPDQRATI